MASTKLGGFDAWFQCASQPGFQMLNGLELGG